MLTQRRKSLSVRSKGRDDHLIVLHRQCIDAFIVLQKLTKALKFTSLKFSSSYPEI